MEEAGDGCRSDFRTWIEVDLAVLESNLRSIKALVPADVSILCVIKAEAYGHGAVEAGRRLQAVGAGYFGVATLDEAMQLRKAGITLPILVLGGILPWESPDPFVEYDITAVVYSVETLERAARFENRKALKVHLKFDTGMGRLGFTLQETDRLVRWFERGLPQVEIEGVMSHFSSSERRDEYGLRQVDAFGKILDVLAKSGIRPKYVHMANSGAICNYPEAYFNMVRPGIMLYGAYPDEGLCARLAVKPVMKWSSRVAAVRVFPPRSALSYGRTYVTNGQTSVAYVPVGYSDGYQRALSNKGVVLIRGARCGVIGRVCMDWILVNVTELERVSVGDPVTLVG
jgi:alanine racemase